MRAVVATASRELNALESAGFTFRAHGRRSGLCDQRLSGRWLRRPRPATGSTCTGRTGRRRRRRAAGTTRRSGAAPEDPPGGTEGWRFVEGAGSPNDPQPRAHADHDATCGPTTDPDSPPNAPASSAAGAPPGDATASPASSAATGPDASAADAAVDDLDDLDRGPPGLSTDHDERRDSRRRRSRSRRRLRRNRTPATFSA